MAERIIFKGILVSETDAARKLSPSTVANAKRPLTWIWIPKSVFTYYSKDAQGNVKFTVERWKVRDVQAVGFDEV